MRLSRAIDVFLNHKQLERDFTDRTIDGYRRCLEKLADDHHADTTVEEFNGRRGTDLLRATLARHWGTASATTRGNRISMFRSFFAWAEEEGIVDDDPARRIKQPPRRRPDVYRPPAVDRELAKRVTTLAERPAWVLMEDLGLRASTVVRVQWRDVDLTHGRIHCYIKGGHRDVLPIPPWALNELRDLYRLLQPEPDHHVFTTEHELEIGNRGRQRFTRDPVIAARTKTLWMMVRRVCRRAGVKEFGPHALRHGYATSFLRESGRDIVSLKELMRHASVQTTEKYADELVLEELEQVLAEMQAKRVSSVAPADDEDRDPVAGGLEARSGPGWNRTTVQDSSDEGTGRNRSEDDSEPRLASPERGHKVPPGSDPEGDTDG